MAIDQADKGFFAEHGYVNVGPVLGEKKATRLAGRDRYDRAGGQRG
jgi:hypothetical protein